MAESFDTELLIEEVKKCSELWDIKCEKYHDKNLKRSAWIRICSRLYSDFEEKTQKEKEEIGKYSYKIIVFNLKNNNTI